MQQRKVTNLKYCKKETGSEKWMVVESPVEFTEKRHDLEKIELLLLRTVLWIVRTDPVYPAHW